MFQIWSLRIALRKFMNLGLMLTQCSHAALFKHCNSTAFWVRYTVIKRHYQEWKNPMSIQEQFSCHPQSFYLMPEKFLRHEVAAWCPCWCMFYSCPCRKNIPFPGAWPFRVPMPEKLSGAWRETFYIPQCRKRLVLGASPTSALRKIPVAQKTLLFENV